MGFGIAIWMMLLGVLGAANLIIAKKPDAKELIGKISPYQGWIGAASAIWGVIILIFWVLLELGMLGHGLWGILLWITNLAISLTQIALGLLLGIGVLKTFIKQPQAVEKMDETVAKLAPYQGKLGLVAIGLGIWGLVLNILY